ncbi:HIT family protein [Halomonas sp. 18H]|uniref:HIT domain-containing protein n=1 Tax=Halomonas almeriensis TaxID=308163 RepID=UPI0022329F7F|nr:MULTISPECIES: HIT family protein [Halomonas]MCW4152577.1 HIT family protein [Halomonas sp. 18H]MDN3553847.1 HIT family protein [Halomonas almeriensis]
MPEFKLDNRLARDGHYITDLPLCQLRLMDDARFPWLVLIPRRHGVSEVTELSGRDQRQLWQEATQAGELLKRCVPGDKLNIATLGNVVAQLHLHVILRRRDDAAWPAPVWGHGEAEPYTSVQQADLGARLRNAAESMEWAV